VQSLMKLNTTTTIICLRHLFTRNKEAKPNQTDSAGLRCNFLAHTLRHIIKKCIINQVSCKTCLRHFFQSKQMTNRFMKELSYDDNGKLDWKELVKYNFTHDLV